MQARILGTTMPVLEVDLQPNESVFSESGELSWMTGSTQMGGGGGLFGVLKRVAGGGSIGGDASQANQHCSIRSTMGKRNCPLLARNPASCCSFAFPCLPIVW